MGSSIWTTSEGSSHGSPSSFEGFSLAVEEMKQKHLKAKR